jgi:proteasome lid subunit RPN8/RPN11
MRNIGWIHTHPDYDCAPSNVDCHTTASFMRGFERFFGIIIGRYDYKVKDSFGHIEFFTVKSKYLDFLNTCSLNKPGPNFDPQHFHEDPYNPGRFIHSGDLQIKAKYV